MGFNVIMVPMVQHYSILGCLREQVEDLAAACKEEVFKRQLEAANDWRTDKELKEACQVRCLIGFLSRQSMRRQDADRDVLCMLNVAVHCPVTICMFLCIMPGI